VTRVNPIERRVEGRYGIVQVAISLASFARKRIEGEPNLESRRKGKEVSGNPALGKLGRKCHHH
jgi:hypothetical protein